MHYPCKPSLFLYRLFCLHSLSLNRPTRVALRLLDSLFDQDLQDVEYALEILYRSDLCLVPEQALGDFTGNRPSSRVRLRVQQRGKARKSEGSEKGEVSLDWQEEKLEDVALGGLRVEVRTVGVLGHFLVGKREDLIEIV